MTEPSSPLTFSTASLRCASALPARKLQSSHELGWTAALVEHHRLLPCDDEFQTSPTDDHTLVVMTRGEQTLEAYGRGRWESARYRAGTVGMTLAGESDRLRRRLNRDAGPACNVKIYVPKRVFAEAADRLSLAGTPYPVALPDAVGWQDALVREAAAGLLRAMRDDMPGLYVEATVAWLALHLLTIGHRVSSEAGRPGEEIADGRLRRVKDRIGAEYASALSLDQLASEAGVSKFHFSRLFRQATGMSPYQYILERRLDAARDLLESTNLSVAEVARSCGFGRADTLAAQFAKRFGKSPREHRLGAPPRF